ncbi:MAG: hypothetical protein Metus_0154 [Candidatus Methanosuratincola subterraneus]|uniref:Uncharacterized protein n=1 Tax=Methanosuratincola subterraneus TaxID=2593994 RepID=A0A444L986_METS7|nr:MAG: hypothetical protein Metus_0154 [Candidatus Methanosuratincola subterraneus]
MPESSKICIFYIYKNIFYFLYSGINTKYAYSIYIKTKVITEGEKYVLK